MDIYLSDDESYLLVCLMYVYGRWRDLLFIKDTEGHIKESMRGLLLRTEGIKGMTRKE